VPGVVSGLRERLGSWMGRNTLHEEQLRVVEYNENPGLKLGRGSAKGLGRMGVMAWRARRMDTEDDDSGSRDTRIDAT
jgi:hypothetical protein